MGGNPIYQKWRQSFYTIDEQLELNHRELKVIRHNGSYWRCFCHDALSKTFHNPLETPNLFI
jgi:hypothetical protein